MVDSEWDSHLVPSSQLQEIPETRRTLKALGVLTVCTHTPRHTHTHTCVSACSHTHGRAALLSSPPGHSSSHPRVMGHSEIQARGFLELQEGQACQRCVVLCSLWVVGPGLVSSAGGPGPAAAHRGLCPPRGPADSCKEHSGPQESASGMGLLSWQDTAQGVPSWDLVGTPASSTQMQSL